MMTVEQLNFSKPLAAVFDGTVDVDVAVEITGVAIDSRAVRPGDLFLAYRGVDLNGVDYIDNAIRAGAVAVAIDRADQIDSGSFSVPIIKVASLRQQAGTVISRFYDEPSKQLRVIGVTGTDGKTTVSCMITHALSLCGQTASLIGTLGYGQPGNIKSGGTTTPDPVSLHSLFSSWKHNIDTVTMEVSSHALDQGRVSGTSFDIAILTNISRDHLDYHHTLEEYAAAKFKLFESTELKHAIINADDQSGGAFIKAIADDINIVAYSSRLQAFGTAKKNLSFVYLEKIETDRLATRIVIQSPWGRGIIYTPLLGRFNVDNLLAAFSALCVSGIPIETAVKALSGFKGVPGRMEYFSANNKPLLVVDYAHTPDALKKALQALRSYCDGKLYCVFGCGGERDFGKRAAMGSIAEHHCDRLVLTNDNPRSEAPERIIEHILEGVKDRDRVVIKPDRSDAITNTFLHAGKDDVVLIAGKGHETTQVIGNELLPFSDRELARRLTGAAS